MSVEMKMRTGSKSDQLTHLRINAEKRISLKVACMFLLLLLDRVATCVPPGEPACVLIRLHVCALGALFFSFPVTPKHNFLSSRSEKLSFPGLPPGDELAKKSLHSELGSQLAGMIFAAALNCTPRVSEGLSLGCRACSPGDTLLIGPTHFVQPT
jgi:hypothetical protein